MGLIYKITGPNNSIYIGQTKYSEEKRWKEHCNSALSHNGAESNTLLGRAIRKYGKNAFIREIVQDNLTDEELDAAETYWIKYYNSCYLDNDYGYNMTYGGQGYHPFNFDLNQLLQLWDNGYTLIELATYFNCCTVTISHLLHHLGVTTAQIFSRGYQKAWIEKMKSKEINNDIYKLWNKKISISEISKQLNVSTRYISKILIKIFNVHVDEIINQGHHCISVKRKIPIIQYDLEDNFIKEWPSAQEAAQNLKLDFSSIRKCAKGIRKSCGGYKWRNKDLTNN